MKNIVTAINNPLLNQELRKEKNFKIIGKDIQYKEGILELLEMNQEIDLIIIAENLSGKIDLKYLIKKIKEKNEKIKIIIILEKENSEKEKMLKNLDITNIYKNNQLNLNELIKIIKEKELNKTEELEKELNKTEELEKELNKLKKIIEENKLIENKVIIKDSKKQIKKKQI